MGATWVRGGLLDGESVQLELDGYSLDNGAESAGTATGVLIPKDDSRPTKVVSHRVVRLLQAAVSKRIEVDHGTDWNASDIAAVVLDGAACLHSGGRTYSGVNAVGDLLPALTTWDEPDGVLQRFSDHALHAGARYVAEGSIGDFLYGYGRLPVGDAELKALPDREATSRWLGIDPTPKWLDPWRQHDLADAGWWNMWHRRGYGPVVERDRPVIKLYVSPRPLDLPMALRELSIVAADLEVPVIKVGSDVHAVHRPDKLVAYVVDDAQLDALVVRLLPRLKGVVPHGVPFTAERSGDGLLSWGSDPAIVEGDGVRESWRQHVTDVAADGLRRARGHDETASVSMARAWLWVNDIDPLTWAPVPG